MQSHLFFICPTDHLEVMVNNVYRSENYFFTSLGNSVIFDSDMTEELNAFIESKSIKDITFVLADDNTIVGDALNLQEYHGIPGLRLLHTYLTKRKTDTDRLWHSDGVGMHLLSWYLEIKADDLHSKINNWLADAINIDTKIYRRQTGDFIQFRSELFQLNAVCMN